MTDRRNHTVMIVQICGSCKTSYVFKNVVFGNFDLYLFQFKIYFLIFWHISTLQPRHLFVYQSKN